MTVIDIGSMCCDCGYETFTVFGPRWEEGGGWDDYYCDTYVLPPPPTPECPEGQSYNPVTQRCEEPSSEVCPEGYVWNSDAEECQEVPPECPDGQVYNPDTEQCEDVLPDPVPTEEATITIKYSFAPEGCELTHNPNNLRTEDVSLPWVFNHGKITEAEFKSEIDEAFGFWKKVFKDEFPWVTINFVPLGDEPGTVSAADTHWVDTDDNKVGDIRFLMADLRRSDLIPLATATMTWFGAEPMADDPHKGSTMKDIRFDPQHPWRLDGEPYRGSLATEGAISSEDTTGYDAAASVGIGFCELCTKEECEEHLRNHKVTDIHGGAHSYSSGYSIKAVALHELGHVFGLHHTGGQATDLEADYTSIMNGGILTSVNFTDWTYGQLDEKSKEHFDASYKADTVAQCVGFVEGWPYDPVGPGGPGLIDICTATVDPTPEDPVFDPEDLPDEGLPSPPGIAAQGPLELAQIEEKGRSPAHLLGTVYYAKERRFDSASTQGLYDIADTLPRSHYHFCPGSPSCRSTLTTWGEGVLYILSPLQEIEGSHDERARAAVQKVDLGPLDPQGGPGPHAVWWVWEADFTKSFPESDSFKREDLSVPFHMGKGKPDDNMQALGLGRPSGLGWDSSIKTPYGGGPPFGGFPKGIQVNPDGEFLNEVDSFEEETASVGLQFTFDCGYGDGGLGFIVDIKDHDPEIGRSNYLEGPIEGSDPPVTTLGLGNATESDGTASFNPPGDEIQLGWVSPIDTSDEHNNTPNGPIMTDLAFCASRGEISKVIPQIVARNNWRYAAGGYTEVDTTAETKTAEVIVLADLRHGLDGQYQSGFLAELGVEANDIAEGNFTAIGDVVVDWLGDRMGDSPVWSGKSLWGDGAGSEFVPFSAEIIGRTVTGGWDELFPLYVPEVVEGVNVWPDCLQGTGPLGDTFHYLDYDSDTGYWFLFGFHNRLVSGHALVGYWRIRRKVGVYKHVQETHLVTGPISSSSGSFPSVSLDEDEKISSVTYYTKPPGMPFEQTIFTIGRKYQGVWDSGWTSPEDFPWATMGDFPTNIKDEWSYYLPKATGEGDLIDPEGTDKFTDYDVATTSESTSLPSRSEIAYYNRTETKDVFIVRIRDETEGIDPAKYFSTTDFPRPHGFAPDTGDGLIDSFPVHYFGTETFGEAPHAEGGTEWSTDPTEPHEADSSIPGGSPFSADRCNEVGYANLNTYERWSAGGGWFLPFEGEAEAAPVIDVNGAVSTQNLGLYSRTQLWFGGEIVFDTMETYGNFTQTTVNGNPVTNWKVDILKGLVPDETVHVPERDYPRTELDAIEVLPGDRIAVLTRKIHRSSDDALESSPQRLTVIGAGGAIKWTQVATGEPIGGDVSSARIVTSSDRWVHIVGFPLNVASVVFGSIHENDIPTPVANNWLISLEDGIKKGSPAVPARIDEGSGIILIGQGHSIDNASWASLWSHSLAEELNFDAPRNSQIINEVTKIPGTEVMHPNQFF